MKNDIKNETTNKNLEQETAENENQNTQEKENLELKVAGLEEKIRIYEEKIDLIVSYLESINEKNRADEVNKITDADVKDDDNLKDASQNELLAKSVYEIARKDLYNELLPLVECAKKYKNREERDKVIKMMILTEEMADAEDRADEMDEIIDKYPALKNSSDLMEKYVTAYVILKGRDACINCKKKTSDELMELFESDEDFKKAVTLKIHEDIKKQNSEPVMNFDGGITSLNIEEKPKNMQDAKNATFRLFK